MSYYIAVDIGASSGRLMLSTFNAEGKINLEEVHRFKNGFTTIDGVDRWDIQHLETEILKGLEKVKKAGIHNCFVGIDTWGVDYCLLDAQMQLVDRPVAYRDHRTKNAMAEFDKRMPLADLYARTGIQLQPFNTVFQLLKETELKQAKKLLLIPDYLGYVFTGEAVMEKTNASTTGLMNLKTRRFDDQVLEALNINESLFPRLVEPGSVLGGIQKENFPTFDLPTATFITVASHDTASAVVGTPGSGEEWAYISSGTWSLMGSELQEGNSTPASYAANFTNEWGVSGTIRYLKNIMGMWLIQEVARKQNYQYSYAELAELASQEPAYQQFIDVNDRRFLNPDNMIEEIQAYCRETHQLVPATPGQLARAIYDNLALCYAVEMERMQALTGKKIAILHIVGGGSNNALLNQLTADCCNVDVLAGPGEATAIGNLVVQMVATSGFGNLAKGRAGIKASFGLKTFQPTHVDASAHVLKNYKIYLLGKEKGSEIA